MVHVFLLTSLSRSVTSIRSISWTRTCSCMVSVRWMYSLTYWELMRRIGVQGVLGSCSLSNHSPDDCCMTSFDSALGLSLCDGGRSPSPVAPRAALNSEEALLSRLDALFRLPAFLVCAFWTLLNATDEARSRSPAGAAPGDTETQCCLSLAAFPAFSMRIGNLIRFAASGGGRGQGGRGG